MSIPRTLSYHGGKSFGNKAGRWIADMLPWEYKTTYVEPFAGMLGILMQRRPVICEIVNDLNGDIYNWWKQVRDNHDELSRLVALTPLSREAFMEARADLKRADTPPVRRAHALCVVVQQSLMHAADAPTWAPLYSTNLVNRWFGNEFAPLANRMARVQLEHRDALEILERVAICPDAVVYCDPPYHSAECDVYGKETKSTDWKRMAELLKAQQGRCAVSGYGDEWDALGWNRFEITKGFTVLTARGHRESQTRTEVLWCNYTPETKQRKMEL